MPDRAARIDAFLLEAGWDDAARETVSGDLSSRKYTRLIRGDARCILMDADSSMMQFATMTRWLRSHALSAPDLIADAAKDGLLLLEDFGKTSLNTHLAENPCQFGQVDDLCIELLLAIRRAEPPELAAPDASDLVEWTLLTDTHYPGVAPGGLSAFRSKLEDLLTEALALTPTVSLRDFHADNMMWLEDRGGIQKLGLLDYQDAFLTHPAYDLMSYLTDARTDVSQDRREEALRRYLDASGDNEEAFRQAFSALSAQRNLRILGIFTKSAQSGKAHHLSKLPRVHRYFAEALEHPAFDTVRAGALEALPDPEHVVRMLS